MENKYKYYGHGTGYVILSDGRIARLLKPTKIYNQEYYNFQVEGKYKRFNVKTLMAMLAEDNKHTEEKDGRASS
jgi:hypothetical protein